MAVLTKPVSTGVGRMFDTGEELAASGTFVATCLDIKDVFGIERRKFQSEEMEKVDLTAFLFGYRDQQGNAHKISSKSMKISGNEKSSLFGFLKSWLGRAPTYGWDYAEMKGKKALITINHELSKNGDREYANIVSISPLPAGMAEAPAAPTTKKKAGPTEDELALARKVEANFSADEIPF